MHYTSRRMQFMDREPIYHDHIPPPSSGHGFYDSDEKMTLRWNSRVGTVYLDGAHVTHEVGGSCTSLTVVQQVYTQSTDPLLSKG